MEGSQGHPRGVVTVEVAGESYRLRAALSVDARLRERTDRSFFAWANDLAAMRSPADLEVDGILAVFEEMAAAADDAPPDGWADDLLMGDLKDVIDGVKKALIASGLLEEGPVPDELQTSGEGEKGG